MFRFAHPEYLYILFAVPLLVGLYLYMRYSRRKGLKRFGEKKLVLVLMPGYSVRRPFIKFILLTLSVIALVFTAAGPQFGTKKETVKKQGIEIVACLDISNSMMSEDIAPNRLDKSKQMLSRFVDKMKDDRIGLIVFAGRAFTQLPITADFVSAKMFFSTLNPNLIAEQGTAIGEAINLASRSFSPNEGASRSIVIITDGENHEDDAIGAATAAKEKGITVNVIGVGSPQGAPIPVAGGRDFKKDNEGNVVITKLNETMCQQIAQAGGGVYVRADNTNNAVNVLQKEFEQMATSELESEIYSEFDEQFQAIAWIVLILLFIEFLIMEKKNPRFKGFNLFSSRKPLLLLLLSLGSLSSVLAQKQERTQVRAGNKEYVAEKFTEAEINYRKSLDVNPKSLEGNYNLGNALYKQKKYKEAVDQWNLFSSPESPLASKSLHNLGNAFYEQQDYQKAVDAYKGSLRLNPADEETRTNLALAQKKLQQQQQQDQNKDKDKDKEDKQDQKQEQEQQQDQKQQDQQPPKEEPKQQQPNKMDQQQAQQLLDALMQDEKDIQDKVREKQKVQQRKSSSKDW